MGISISQAAAEHVAQSLAARGSGVGLRLGVKVMGCSGYGYVIDYAESVAEQDVVFEAHGIKVVVAEEHLSVIDGTQVDYVQKGLQKCFVFDNPRAVSECGCGESFSIDPSRVVDDK